MSICLIDSGFQLMGYTDPMCEHGHARGAESLANYLWKQVGRPKIATSADQGRKNAIEKTGLIFFKDIVGFRDDIGDHIDLWSYGITPVGKTYFDRCEQSWFWEVE